MESIVSYSDVNAKFADNSKSILLLYKSGHRESECAYHNLEIALQNVSSISAYTADVNTVLDIHPHYGVTKVPSILIFDNGSFKKAVKGCQSNEDYKELMSKAFKLKKGTSKSKLIKNVSVYSTPSCGWCISLKTWMQQNRIVYTDIDISQDHKAAQDLVMRSGHKGVPQIDINGQMVIGFQLPRLKELLEIK